MASSLSSSSLARPASSTARTVVTALGLGMVAVVAVTFFIMVAAKYFDLTESSYGFFWPRRYGLLLHVTGGTLAILIGPFQFWTGLRRVSLHVHRWVGRTYMSGVAMGIVGGFYLAVTTPVGWQWAVSLLTLDFAWLLTTGMAFLAIRKRRIQPHKEWMIRSYIVTFAFVGFRIIVEWPSFVLLGDFPQRAPTAIWLSFVPALLVAEVLLQWKRVIGRRGAET